MVSSAMPMPVQMRGAPVFRPGLRDIVAIPIPSLSSIDCRTAPSESTIAERPGKTPSISFGGGLYDRPTLLTIATGTPSFPAYHEAKYVPGGDGNPPLLRMSGEACGISTKSTDSFRNCAAAKQ